MKLKLTEPKESPAPKPAVVEEASSESEDAASDLIAAVKAGDAKAANLALKRHYELCAYGEDDDEEA